MQIARTFRVVLVSAAASLLYGQAHATQLAFLDDIFGGGAKADASANKVVAVAIKTGNAGVDQRFSIHKVHYLDDTQATDTFKPTPDDDASALYVVHAIHDGRDLFLDDQPPYSKSAITFTRRMSAAEQEAYKKELEKSFFGRLAANSSIINTYIESAPLRTRVRIGPFYNEKARSESKDATSLGLPSFGDVDAIYKALFRASYERACFEEDLASFKNMSGLTGGFPSIGSSIKIEQLKNYKKMVLVPVMVTRTNAHRRSIGGGRQSYSESYDVAYADPVVENALLNSMGGHFKDGIYKLDKVGADAFISQYKRFLDGRFKVSGRFSLTEGITDNNFDPILKLRKDVSEGKYPNLKDAAIMVAVMSVYDGDSDAAEEMRKRYRIAGNFFTASATLFGWEELPAELNLFGMMDQKTAFSFSVLDKIEGEVGDVSKLGATTGRKVQAAIETGFQQSLRCAVFSNDVATSKAKGFRIDRMDSRLMKSIK